MGSMRVLKKKDFEKIITINLTRKWILKNKMNDEFALKENKSKCILKGNNKSKMKFGEKNK